MQAEAKPEVPIIDLVDVKEEQPDDAEGLEAFARGFAAATVEELAACPVEELIYIYISKDKREILWYMLPSAYAGLGRRAG